jgi:hypothetical protein
MAEHQGRYYALDQRLCVVFVFDGAWRFLFKIDRKSDGPGLYNFISDFNIHPFSDEAKAKFPKRIEELFAQFPYLIHAVRHNSRYVFATISQKDIDHWANIIYDKVTGESKFITEFTEKVVFNSHRGEEIIVTDEYVLAPSQWVDLEKRIKKEMLDDTNRAIFEELLAADMEQNPVLIKYRFK